MSCLLIATPVRGAELWSSHVTVGYSECVRALARELPVKELSATVTFSADVVRGRNRIAATVLREKEFADVSHVLWWDDDEWPEDRRIIGEMMRSGEDMIAAPYTNKRLPLRWVYQPLLGAKPVDAGALKVLPVRGVGFGFTMTSRACLERMSASAKSYVDLPNPHRIANIFGQLYDEMQGPDGQTYETLLSEDYSFCKRWREMGGRVALYMGAGIIHHAGMHAWSAREMPGGVL